MWLRGGMHGCGWACVVARGHMWLRGGVWLLGACVVAGGMCMIAEGMHAY